mgnify:CR=1 FL=1
MYHTASEILLPPNMVDYLDTNSKFGDALIVRDGVVQASTVRSTRVCLRDDNDWVAQFCRHHVQVINEDVYKFHLNDGFDSGKYQYAHYNVGDYYSWHQDNIWKHNQIWDRKLSFSLLLNDDYDGGYFEFVEPIYGEELTWNITRVPTKAGTLIVFPSMMAHRVTPVTNGTRKSVVGWCVGRQFA